LKFELREQERIGMKLHTYTAIFEEGIATCYRRLLSMMEHGLVLRDSVTRVPHLATHVFVGY
jgi:hypothetical protein